MVDTSKNPVKKKSSTRPKTLRTISKPSKTATKKAPPKTATKKAPPKTATKKAPSKTATKKAPSKTATKKNLGHNKNSEPEVVQQDDAETKRDIKIVGNLRKFLIEVNTLSDTLPVTMDALRDHMAEDMARYKKIRERLLSDENSTPAKSDSGEEIRKFHQTAETTVLLRQYMSGSEQMNKRNVSRIIIPRAFLNILVSQFDAFLGRLIGDYLEMFPVLVEGETMSLSQVLAADSIEEIRGNIIERQVDNQMRESHEKQIKWLEHSANVKLIEHIKRWDSFVEITERRNLFTHNDGVVNKTYLDKTKSLDIAPPPEPGKRLSVNKDYFISASQVFTDVAVQVSQRVWRKCGRVDPEKLNNQLYKLGLAALTSGRADLASIVLEIAAAPGISKVFDEGSRLINHVNLAIAYRDLGDLDKSAELMGEIDWSARPIEFELADAVLREDLKVVFRLMDQIGGEGRPSKEDYAEWPLFRIIREQPEFQTHFEKVFGEPFTKVAAMQTELSES